MRFDLGEDLKKMKIVTGAAALACNPWDRAPHTGVRLRLHSALPGKRGRGTPDESNGARVMTWAQKNRALHSAIRDQPPPWRPASIPAGGRHGIPCSQS